MRPIKKTNVSDASDMSSNVTSSVEIDRFFGETEKQLGAVDVLVNNAEGVRLFATTGRE